MTNKENMNILVSVIVPVYNVYRFLKQCIESITRQTYSNLEIILVDDGSTDGSERICDEYFALDSRIKVIHQSNSGASVARNTGIKVAKGKYVYFCDGDDWIAKNAIETLMEHAEQTICDIVLFDALVTDEYGNLLVGDDRYVRSHEYLGMKGWEAYVKLLQKDEYVCQPCTFFFSKSFLDKSKLEFPVGMLFYEDELFAFELFIKAEKVCHINDRLYYRRLRIGSTMNTPFSVENVRSLYKTICSIMNYELDVFNIELADSVKYHLSLFWDRCFNLFFRLDFQEQAVVNIYKQVIELGVGLGVVKNDSTKTKSDYTRIIWYGAGKRSAFLLQAYPELKPDEIWDRDAKLINDLFEYKIKKPNFEFFVGEANALLVVCIDNAAAYNEVRMKCEDIGFYNFSDWRTYLLCNKGGLQHV